MSDTIKIVGNETDLRAIMPTLSQRRQYHRYDASPVALAEHAMAVSKANTNWHGGFCRVGGESFSGTETLADAQVLANEGWPEGAARVASLRDRINADHPTMRRLSAYSVAGHYVDVQRYVSGNPAYMRHIRVDVSKRRPVLTLVSDMSANCDVAGTSLTNRAAVVAAIVDAIEAAGFSCHVIAASAVRARDADLACMSACTLKAAGETVDTGKLAFGLGHAAMFRRLLWVGYSEDAFTIKLETCLGTALPLAGLARPDDTFILAGIDRQTQTKFADENHAATDGLEYLLASLRDQNCPAFNQE
jgi:hypothetical protein